MQFQAQPDRPDPLLAKKVQELLGGQWGEISVSMSYLLQGWSCRMPGKYKDLLLDIGTEELAHIEILSTLIAKLLEDAPAGEQEHAMADDPSLAAVIGGMNPQHAIVAGLGPRAADSAGNPWSGAFAQASGNLLADFRFNVTAESQGRLQASRIYKMTDDAGVKETLSFLIARDTMHQNMWLAAIQELEADMVDGTPVPMDFPQEQEHSPHAYTYWPLSDGGQGVEGPWANGPAPDGKGEFSVTEPTPEGPVPMPPKPAPHLFAKGTPGPS
ncbi:manganese catalase [Egicoccus halophilus]|uniref:Manganese catalase n=1 Tax=Egicoccus halophilus TaxID=1670830 RepID=A0A8J3A6Y9_9ACTN|nr:manganese catalase [Egicoccus halophilus]